MLVGFFIFGYLNLKYDRNLLRIFNMKIFLILYI